MKGVESEKRLLRFDDFLQFTRYLKRASVIRKISEKEMELIDDGIFPNEMFLLFFALLYVVVEVFKGFSFNDNVILFLLGDKYNNQIEILRRMRNSIFHPDKSIFSKRQADFLDDCRIIIPWAYTLYDEFERFMYFFPEIQGVYGKDADELRLEIKKINKWLPERAIDIRKKECLDEINTYKSNLKKLKTKKRIKELEEIENIEKRILKAPNSVGEKFGLLLNNKNQQITRP